jgi:hypothetical protein
LSVGLRGGGGGRSRGSRPYILLAAKFGPGRAPRGVGLSFSTIHTVRLHWQTLGHERAARNRLGRPS